MDTLKKRIQKENPKQTKSKEDKYVNYNTKYHDIFIRLNTILSGEKKSSTYSNVVYRLFNYLLLYLEKTKSPALKIISRNNKQYYYFSKLNIKDVEDFYLNTTLSESTKHYYMNILKKYIKLLNRNSKLRFSKNVASYKKKKNVIPQIIKSIIQKLKDFGNNEYFVLFFFLFFFGLNIYQISKISIKNINKEQNSISFVSYKHKHRLFKHKKIPKAILTYFNEFYETIKNKKGFLFFNDLRDKKNNTRKNQIENIIILFMKENLKLKYQEIAKFIKLFNDERPSIRLGGITKQIFSKYITVIDFDLFE